jgi:hypothetical protein
MQQLTSSLTSSLIKKSDHIQAPSPWLPWVISGSPNMFLDRQNREPWFAIQSRGGHTHHAGLRCDFLFHAPASSFEAQVECMLHSTNEQLHIRIGILPGDRSTNPLDHRIQWSGWHGPNNQWSGKPPMLIVAGASDLPPTRLVTVFLESKSGNWPTRTSISWWRNFTITMRVDDPEPEPEPDPDPDPDPQSEIKELLEREFAIIHRAQGAIKTEIVEMQAAHARIETLLKRFGVVETKWQALKEAEELQ